MPTGYTHGVQTGDVTEFGEFLMQCARAFGACLSLRDEPASTPIPAAFEPSDYNFNATRKAEDRLAKYRAMTDEEWEAKAVADYAAEVDKRKQRRANREEQRARYEAMLEKANAWQPPTREHQGLKDFMIEQLTGSIDFDCGELLGDEPQFQGAAKHRHQCIEAAKRDIAYHRKAHLEEVARCQQCTEWVRALRQSIEEDA